jgi:hypothetical protein
VSCNTTSKLLFARITPVAPPDVNKNINPITHNIWGDIIKTPEKKETNQEKIFTPVGTPTTKVAKVK